MKLEQLAETFAGARGALGGHSPAELLARFSQVAPRVTSLVMVIVVGWLAARAVWLLYPPAVDGTWLAPPPPVRGTAPTSASATDVQPIVAAHLFGEAQATAVPAGDAPADAPDTSLSLQLRAAIAAGNQKFAHAIIADAGGQERVYFVNDGLPGGATLQRVEIDRVVLARNGAFEVLRLPRLGSGPPAPPRAGARPVTASPATANVQGMVARNAAGFLDVIRPQPFMPDGQLKGYRIYPGPNRDQFTALGLRPGDLVTEINGVTLDNPAQGMEVFRSLGEAAQVSITVEREGQPTVLSLNMNQISTLGGATQ